MAASSYQWRTRQELDVCQDCVHVSYSGAPDFEGYVESGHAERYLKAVQEYGDEPVLEKEESSFSTHPCEFCGGSFAGDRYTISVMQLHTDGS